VVRVLVGLCSATSLKRSRRELFINVAEHRSMLKNNKSKLPVLVSYPKQVQHSQNGGFVFTVIRLGSVPCASLRNRGQLNMAITFFKGIHINKQTNCEIFPFDET